LVLSVCLGLVFALPQCVSREKPPETAPDFTLTSFNGEEIRLSELRGKTIFLDFWATWCGPCRESIPHLVNLYKTHRENGFIIIGVSVDKGGADPVRRFVAAMDIAYPIAMVTPDLEKQYGVTALPTGFLIDKKGRIREKFLGFSPSIAKQLEAKAVSLMSEKP
jgi:cytochrome c biogenesis protein CcmG, thiol:disulfide interchange protein DsbE